MYIKLLFIALLFASCSSPEPVEEPRTTDLIPNTRYLYSINYDSKNPFVSEYADTVTVLEIKQGYVKWRNSDGYIRSGSLRMYRADFWDIPEPKLKEVNEAIDEVFETVTDNYLY